MQEGMYYFICQLLLRECCRDTKIVDQINILTLDPSIAGVAVVRVITKLNLFS